MHGKVLLGVAPCTVGGFGCLELVLYGIRELAQHHYELLGNDLHIEWTTLLLTDWRRVCTLQFIL